MGGVLIITLRHRFTACYIQVRYCELFHFTIHIVLVALNLSSREQLGKAAWEWANKSGYMRAQYCELAMEPMALMLALGSWPRPVPPGTCTGTETPGDIRPEKHKKINYMSFVSEHVYFKIQQEYNCSWIIKIDINRIF